MTLEQVLVFIPAAFVVGVSPGANNLLAFASASKAGWRKAAGGVWGRIAAWALLVVLVSFGLDAVLSASETAFVALKWAGVGYLLFLAWKFWNAETGSALDVPNTGTLARREFLTLMGNPKAYLLLTAFLPQFVDNTAPSLPQLLALGGFYLVLEGMAAMFWIVLGAIVGSHALSPWRRRIVNRISAGLMASAALLLARSGRAA